MARGPAVHELPVLRSLDFHGSPLATFEHQGEHWIVVRPVVEGMGLDWAGQQQKLSADPKRFSCMDIHTTAADGKRYEVLCLPLRRYPMWLATINPAKIPPPAVPPVSMLTTEIAELTGKAHRHVMRDTRSMLVELHGDEGLPRFGQSYRAGNGKMEPCFSLPKREVMIFLTGYSIPLRAAVIDRLELYEAEAVTRFAAPAVVTMTDRAKSFVAA